MNPLADEVLPLIRTRADIWRWSSANAHGSRMHHAVDVLEAAVGSVDPAEVYSVTHTALASAITVVAGPTTRAGSSAVPADGCSSCTHGWLRRRTFRPPG